jgi:hypothetical protein
MPISGPPPVILPASLPQISGQPDAQKIPNLPINYAPTQIPQLVASDSHNIYTKSMAEIPRAETIETKEDNSINFAIESILNAILLMTNGDKTQANTAMNLIGAGKDLPKKVKAVLKVVEKQWESEFFEAVVNEIANRFNKKQLFVDKTLRYLFGENGNLLTQW